MSEAKHTPGPWHVYKGHGLYVDSSSAGSICKIAEKRASEQQQANARLIAASPELLDALNNAIPFLRRFSEHVVEQFGVPRNPVQQMLDHAEKLIAKIDKQ